MKKLTYISIGLIFLIVFIFTIFGTETVIAQSIDNSDLSFKLDSTAKAHAADSAIAGVAVAVVHENDTLLMDGYGLADLEFDVPMPKDAIFEIGSITKQFTAAAILQLAEKDSLDLDADITEYLPDFNTRVHRVTVRNLLHHTSGLRSYPNMSHFRDLSRKDLPRDTLLTLIESEPFRFAPGTAMSYSNTGYFLLGLIIEEKSGQPYEDYVSEHLFEPAGMENSYYCDERAVKHHRAHGYSWNPKQGFLQKRYLSHIWPFAAGSLCSTAPDLMKWNQALHGGKILSDSMYQKMITPGQLDDGTKLRYGNGLGIYEENDYSIISHGGGIYGFISESRYYPNNSLTIVALQNTVSPKSPQVLADSLARFVLGSNKNSLNNNRYKGNLGELTGRYTGPSRGEILDLFIQESDGNLLAKQVGSEEADTLRYSSGLTWKKRNAHYRFVRSGDQVTELLLDVISGHYVLRRIREEF